MTRRNSRRSKAGLGSGAKTSHNTGGTVRVVKVLWNERTSCKIVVLPAVYDRLTSGGCRDNDGSTTRSGPDLAGMGSLTPHGPNLGAGRLPAFRVGLAATVTEMVTPVTPGGSFFMYILCGLLLPMQLQRRHPAPEVAPTLVA